MVYLGAHESISGGIYKAVETAKAVGCDCLQLFTKNSNQWNAKDLKPSEIAQFQESLERLGISHPLSHDSFLINLASPDDVLWNRSIAAFEVEMLRADQLGIPYVVMHPGSYTTSSEQAGLDRIAEGLNLVLKHTAGIQTRCLLETMAGQGSNLGGKFEHLAAIIEGVEGSGWHEKTDTTGEFTLGICFDTCHVFASGVDFSTPEQFEAMKQDFDRVLGLKRLKAIHLNDSKHPCGSRKDRHEHIGLGMLGLEPFRLLLNDPQMSGIPMYLETNKGVRVAEDGTEEDWDSVNLKVLRSLVDSEVTA